MKTYIEIELSWTEWTLGKYVAEYKTYTCYIEELGPQSYWFEVVFNGYVLADVYTYGKGSYLRSLYSAEIACEEIITKRINSRG